MRGKIKPDAFIKTRLGGDNLNGVLWFVSHGQKLNWSKV